MDRCDDAAGQFRDQPKTAGDFDETPADMLADDDARRRDNVLRHVVRAIRDEPQPEGALIAILAVLGLALDAAGGASLRHDADGPLHVAASWGAKPPAAVVSAVRAGLERDGRVALAHHMAQIAAQPILYRGEIKGALLLWRSAERAAFAAVDCALLADVADHLGIVLAQVEARERIEHLSRTDQLTGLANRAAFFDEFTRRLSRFDRNRPAAALLYVDVANLRHVNAVRGPDAGDAALSALSGLLREHTRPGDLIARFGGGEFVVWIERIDPAGARARATALATAAARLAPFASVAEPAFGVSVGVAPFDPTRGETVMQLVLRAAADAARTKEQGGEPWAASLPA
ncbi:MAG TPA: GGDEF domain-containing protein [Stellaceae bacterium]|nr:GGDEF domain-containing protein [Stellaceae bacterium]